MGALFGDKLLVKSVWDFIARQLAKGKGESTWFDGPLIGEGAKCPTPSQNFSKLFHGFPPHLMNSSRCVVSSPFGLHHLGL